MKKILKGSVIETPEGAYHWVIEHKGEHIKVRNEEGYVTFIGEATAKRSTIRDGGDAMDVIKKFWYGP